MINKKPVLIVVDDEADLLENYKSLLEDDFEVIAYNNPLDFIASIKKSDFKVPDILMTDLKMPQMTGVEMIRQARSAGMFFPFILLSGFLEKSVILEAIELGAFQILEKPASVDQILKAIDQLLIEHEVLVIKEDIRLLSRQLRELYTGMRFLFEQYIPKDVLDEMIVDAPNGQIKQKMSFEGLLEQLEMKFETLLESEKSLTEFKMQSRQGLSSK